jgi:hypothetical protein
MVRHRFAAHGLDGTRAHNFTSELNTHGATEDQAKIA